jgi:hypothetical protein
MAPILPFWFKQRQCNAEPVGDGYTLKVSGPNLAEAFIGIGACDNRWRAFLRQSVDGPEAVATEAEFDNANDAWEAAFELYRTSTIV